MLLASFVTAQEETVDAGVTPDSMLYGLDKAMERLRLAATFGNSKNAEVHLQHAEERMAELQEMIEEKKTKHVEKLTQARDKSMEKA